MPIRRLFTVSLLIFLALTACSAQPTVDTGSVAAVVQTAVAEIPTTEPVVVDVTRIVEVTREVEVTRQVKVVVTATPTPTPEVTPTPQGYDVTATEVLTGLMDAGLPIGENIAYTAETDPNELLGRPGQYTSKANFRDTRLAEQFGDFDPGDGGSIEVFPDVAGARGRSEYVQTLGQIFSPTAEYHFIEENVLLRLSHRLLPEQAEAYEEAFRDSLE